MDQPFIHGHKVDIVRCKLSSRGVDIVLARGAELTRVNSNTPNFFLFRITGPVPNPCPVPSRSQIPAYQFDLPEARWGPKPDWITGEKFGCISARLLGVRLIVHRMFAEFSGGCPADIWRASVGSN